MSWRRLGGWVLAAVVVAGVARGGEGEPPAAADAAAIKAQWREVNEKLRVVQKRVMSSDAEGAEASKKAREAAKVYNDVLMAKVTEQEGGAELVRQVTDTKKQLGQMRGLGKRGKKKEGDAQPAPVIDQAAVDALSLKLKDLSKQLEEMKRGLADDPDVAPLKEAMAEAKGGLSTLMKAKLAADPKGAALQAQMEELQAKGKALRGAERPAKDRPKKPRRKKDA